jgi:hypothetical protein
VNNLNQIVATSRPELGKLSLEEIIKTEKPGKPFNQAAQVNILWLNNLNRNNSSF